jgi:hypothetical protein
MLFVKVASNNQFLFSKSHSPYNESFNMESTAGPLAITVPRGGKGHINIPGGITG